MIQASVTVKNIEAFDSQYDDVFLAIDANLNEIASIVKAAADATAEYKDKTGYLRRHTKKRKSKFVDGGYIVFNNAPHAHLIEYGHVKFLFGKITGERVPAHPFMRKALAAGINAAIASMPKRSSK